MNDAFDSATRRMQQEWTTTIELGNARATIATLTAERDDWIEKCKAAVWADSEMCKHLEAEVAALTAALAAPASGGAVAVQRWRPGFDKNDNFCGMYPDPEGDWVAWEDVARQAPAQETQR